MTGQRLQFRLWHLLAAVVLCSVVFALIRAISDAGLGSEFPIVWVTIGILIGHYGGTALLAWIDWESRSSAWNATLIICKTLFVWMAEAVVIGLACWLTTSDIEFAFQTGLWLGTAVFVCSVALYEVCRPYKQELRKRG